jgi:hypothetical protein
MSEGGRIILSGNVILKVSKRKKNDLLKIFLNK